jgi:hypothetical protein
LQLKIGVRLNAPKRTPARQVRQEFTTETQRKPEQGLTDATDASGIGFVFLPTPAVGTLVIHSEDFSL